MQPTPARYLILAVVADGGVPEEARLDSQRMWHELTDVAPERAAKQVERSRTTVELLVCLLALARAWYEVAVQATDDWAAAVRALVNVGRAPLADALALSLPPTLGAEREMWGLVASLTVRPYHPRRAALDRYRIAADRRAGD